MTGGGVAQPDPAGNTTGTTHVFLLLLLHRGRGGHLHELGELGGEVGNGSLQVTGSGWRWDGLRRGDVTPSKLLLQVGASWGSSGGARRVHANSVELFETNIKFQLKGPATRPSPHLKESDVLIRYF